jgi:hypothetical protein
MNEKCFNIKMKTKVVKNMKLIASLLYHAMMRIISNLAFPKEYDNNPGILEFKFVEEPLKKHMLLEDQLEFLFEVHPEYIDEVQHHMENWLSKSAF